MVSIFYDTGFKDRLVLSVFHVVGFLNGQDRNRTFGPPAHGPLRPALEPVKEAILCLVTSYAKINPTGCDRDHPARYRRTYTHRAGRKIIYSIDFHQKKNVIKKYKGGVRWLRPMSFSIGCLIPSIKGIYGVL
jgi:hypothetical protein